MATLPPHPSENKNVLSFLPLRARRLTWLSSQRGPPAALQSQCADGIGLEGPDGFLVFNCMYLSHIWSQPQDSLCLCLHGTRRTLSSLHLGVNAPPLCLCRKNWLAWHISALLLRADFLFYETWTRSAPTFLKSMSRASSPGKAWIISSFSSTILLLFGPLLPPEILQANDSLYVLSQWAENLERISGL